MAVFGMKGMEHGTGHMGYERPMRTHEAAKWAGMSERQLLEFARQGVIPAKKIGGTWYFSPKRLAEFFGVD